MSNDGWTTVSHKKQKQKKTKQESVNTIESIEFPSEMINNFYGKIAFDNLKNTQLWDRYDRCLQLNKKMDKEIDHYTDRFEKTGDHEVMTWVGERVDQKAVYIHYLNNIKK